MARKRQLVDISEFIGQNTSDFKVDNKIMKTIDQTFRHMVDKHNMDRIVAYHFEYRYPEDYQLEDDGKNEHFRRTQGSSMKHLTRKECSPHYVAVREQKDNEKHPHYHVLLFGDERNFPESHCIAQTTDVFLSSALGYEETQNGLVHNCSKGNQKHVIKINSPDSIAQIDSLYKHGAYFAKADQKDYNNGTRELFSSNLNHEQKKKKRKSK